MLLLLVRPVWARCAAAAAAQLYSAVKLCCCLGGAGRPLWAVGSRAAVGGGPRWAERGVQLHTRRPLGRDPPPLFSYQEAVRLAEQGGELGE